MFALGTCAPVHVCGGGWTGCGNPGVKGAGSLREAGEEREGKVGFPMWWEPGEIGKHFTTLHMIFCNKKMQKLVGSTTERAEPGVH